MPTDLTFVFGHTHKPFEKDMRFDGYPEWIDVYNTGGWVIETKVPDGLHGGAVVLVDEDLDVTSLRMFQDDGDIAPEVQVRRSTHRGKEPSPFHDRIAKLVKEHAAPWRRFSEAASEAARVRRNNL